MVRVSNSLRAVAKLTLIQGSSCFLLAAQFPTFARCTRRTKVYRLLWSLRYCLDRRGCRHPPNKASRRQHVRWFPWLVMLFIADICDSSFFQSVCIIGYTLFPLVIASTLSAVGLPMIARIPVYLVLVAWSVAAGVSILGGSGVVKNRVGLAVFPLLVFYIGLGCLCFIS
jgi:hypothetical protein